MLPCKFLTSEKKCKLVVNEIVKKEQIGSGKGCCSETQKEKIKRLF